MSKNVEKDDEGYIVNPQDPEDLAYNLAQEHDLPYRTQVELEASLFELALADSDVKRAITISQLLHELKMLTQAREGDFVKLAFKHDYWKELYRKERVLSSILTLFTVLSIAGWFVLLLSQC